MRAQTLLSTQQFTVKSWVRLKKIPEFQWVNLQWPLWGHTWSSLYCLPTSRLMFPNTEYLRSLWLSQVIFLKGFALAPSGAAVTFQAFMMVISMAAPSQAVNVRQPFLSWLFSITGNHCVFCLLRQWHKFLLFISTDAYSWYFPTYSWLLEQEPHWSYNITLSAARTTLPRT